MKTLLPSLPKHHLRYVYCLYMTMVSVFLLTSMSVIGQASSTYNTTGNQTFVVPAGVTQITVECWGGGGRGGSRTSNGYGGGGGGGAYSRSLLSVTPGSTINLHVGAGAPASTSTTPPNGTDSWFGSATTVMAKGGNSVSNNTTTAATGGLASEGYGDVRFNGGNGANASGSAGGGGGSSAGNSTNGTNATNNLGANAPAGGGDGGNGRSGSSGVGSGGDAPGGGGGGAYRSTTTNRNGGAGGNGRVVVSWVPAFVAQFNTMSYGSSVWCPGETRTVSVTVTNAGQATWTNASPQIRIGVKWNGDADYFVRTNANGLAPGATETYYLTITAPTTPGNNNLTFDVVNELNCWFGNNNGSCGPGNTVFTSPNISISGVTAGNITGDDGVCVGSQNTLTPNPTGTGPFNYTWNSSDNGILTVTNAGVITGIQSGSASVTYTVTDAGGCTATSAPYNVTVHAAPGGSLTATDNSGIAPNDQIICAGENITFTATAGFNAYIFKVNGATVQSGVSRFYSTTSLNNGDIVTVDVATANNCLVTLNPITVTVTPTPSGTLNFAENSGLTPNDGVICSGSMVTFTATAGFSNYAFKINGSTVQSGASNILNTTAIVADASVTVEITNAGNCKFTTPPVLITVVQTPAVDNVITENSGWAADDNTICAGDVATITATAGFTNYQFWVNGTDVQNSASNVYSNNNFVNPSIVSVTAMDAQGCSVSSSNQIISVNDLPVGTLNIFEQSGIDNDGIICSGSPVQFEATAGYHNYQFKINGANAQNGAANTFTTSTLNHGDIVSVEVSSDAGCTIEFNSFTMVVNSVPVVALTATETSGNTPDDAVICTGGQVIFTATAGYDNYEFLLNGTAVQNGSSNVFNSNTLSDGDEAQVVATHTNGCSTNSGIITMTVHALPTAAMGVSEHSGIAANDNIICTGATVTFEATAGYASYAFRVNGTILQQSASPVFATQSLNNGDLVDVVVTSIHGCTQEITGVIISVQPLPVVSLSVTETSGTANDGIICFNSVVTFTATAGLTQYDFYVDGVMVQSSASNTYTSAFTSDVPVHVVAFNNHQCSQTSNTVQIQVLPLPAGSLLVIENSGSTANDGAICTGALVTFSAPSGYSTYTFTVNSIAVQSGALSNYTTNALNDGDVVQVEITDVHTCSNTLSPVVISVHPYPVVPAITGPSNVCLHSSITVQNTLAGGTWSSDDHSIASINPVTGVITANNTGTVTIRYSYTNPNGCTTQESVQITVNGLPTPTLSGPNPFCPESISVYTTEAGQFNYTWTVNGGVVMSGGTNTDHQITIDWSLPGVKSIFVNYTDANGCSGATSSTVTGTTGITPVISGLAAVCTGTNSVVYSTQSGQTDYTWSATNATITSGGGATDNTVTVTWNTPGMQEVRVNFTDANGCTSPEETVYPVVVRPIPTAAISGSTAVCHQAAQPSVTFTGNGGTAPYTFTYQMNGGATQTISTTVGNTVTLAVPTGTTGTFVYTLLSVADVYNCGQSASGTASITVHPLPTASMSGTATTCVNGSSPAVTFTGAGGTAPYTFSYSLNGGATQTIVSVGNTATLNAPVSTAGTFTYQLLSVSDANSCAQTQTGTAVITVNPLPQATISGTTAVCINDATPVITFTGSNGTAPYTFTYNINNGSNQTIVSTGNTATLNVPTVLSGVLHYNLVAVSDASATACSTALSQTATVTIHAASVGGTLSGNATVCVSGNSGSITLNGHTGNIVRWEYSTDGGSNFTPISHTASSYTYNNLTTTTIFRVVVGNGTCATTYSSTATITVLELPVGGTVSASTTVCAGVNTGNVQLNGHTGNIVRWQSSVNGGSTWTNIAHTGSTFTFNNLTQTTQFRAEINNTACASVYAAPATITVNARPTALLSGTHTICEGRSATLTIQVTGSGLISGTLSGGIPFSGTAPTITVVVSPTTTTMYSIQTLQDGLCSALPAQMIGSSTVNVNTLPASISVTPATVTLCEGTIQSLTTSGAYSAQSSTFSSGVINQSMPDAFTFLYFTIPGDGNRTLNVSGIPAGAIITGVDVNINATHGRTGDMIFNIQAPNGNRLNLINRRGGNGDNFTNTTISSAGVTSLGSASAPFTGIYAPDAVNGLAAGGNSSNVTTFPDLYSVPNGNWILRYRDAQANTQGTLVSWSVTIHYTIPSSVPSVWSPATDLFTNAAATIPYNGTTPLTTVYVKPSTPGLKTYTATFTNVSGCSTSAQTQVNVNPLPVVQIVADYCSDPGYVRLTANSTPGGSFNWSTGETTSSILVDEAGSYSVTVTTASGCVRTAFMSIAQELIVNGDFEAGNVGFTSAYSYVNPTIANGMYPEATYTVNDNPNFNHNNFWGRDHTSGSGRFMIINGAGSPVNIWEQTVTVLPNTTYYFSAWAMSLNSVPPYAQLQFNVNGTNVGTTAVLGPRAPNNNPPFDWVRFYGTWTSGPATTTAVVSIVDLQTALGGNDFGLDDISFGTLSTFIRLESPVGTDAQTPCINTPINNIVYSVGSSASGPIVTGLPPGITGTFNGENYTISGTPTTAGNYTYTLTTSGSCNPVSVTGTIQVREQTISLTSGSNPLQACRNLPITPLVYTIGGSATGANVSGLPSGVTAQLVGNTLTISGTPVNAGTYNFTIQTTGSCAPKTLTGSIVVQQQTISVQSGSATQTRCVNTAITNVVLNVGGTATGASVTGLPPGVTGSYAGGLFIISGSATTAGVYPYTITTSGNCNPATLNGTLTINPAATIALTSGAGSNLQTVCRHSAIVPITYSVGGGGTNANVSGLPSGVTGSFSGGVFTISGTPTVVGTFNYTVTTTGSCAQTNATGTIVVQAATISLASGATIQTRCPGVAFTNIVYNIGGVATGATVSGLPDGVTGTYSGGQFTISGTPTTSGVYAYTVSTTGGCTPATAGGTLTVSPESIGGTVSQHVICSGGSGILQLTGYQGNILGWERSVDGGTTWINIANTAFQLNYTNITQTTLYRARVRNGSCAIVYSTIGSVSVGNVWTGIVSDDWFDAQNWAGNQMPSSDCPYITIPQVSAMAYYPVIENLPVQVNHINIHSGASLTVTNTSISVSGIIQNQGTFDVTNATLELNGTQPQHLDANTFYNNTVQHLLIGNSSATGVELNGPLAVTTSLHFTTQGQVFNTNGHLTLRSTADETAWVGNTTGKTLLGEVTVERYIHTGTGPGQHGKGWQLLAIPTQGSQTIKQSWQEGASNINHNPVPGYGTMITGQLANAVAEGFDVRTPAGATLKTFNATTGVWDGVTSTTNRAIQHPNGYMILVRGDRSVITSNAAATPTTLRTKGLLFSNGMYAPPVVTVPGGKFQSVGNPFASAVDLTSAGVSFDNLADVYYVWDPQLTTQGSGSSYGLGGYQTFVKDFDGNYRVTPGGGSYGAPGSVKNTIESGQAFMVFSSEPLGGNTGSVTFTEEAKIAGSNLVSRATHENIRSIRTQLYVAQQNENVLLDGNAVQFHDSWTNEVDVRDAKKIGNTGENFGLMREGAYLAVERRKPVVLTDTIFYNMGQLRAQTYQLEFNPSMLEGEGLTAWLIDNHLQTTTPVSLSDMSTYSFTATAAEPGSYAADRFMLVFQKAMGPLPVTITSVSATRNRDNTVAVRWTTENETDMRTYEVERSENGVNFTGIITTHPTANNGGSARYIQHDLSPLKQDNFYRIKAISQNGLIQYSPIVKVDALESNGQIAVYPNPVENKTIHLRFTAVEPGTYMVRLLSSNGQEVYNNRLSVQTSNATHTLYPAKHIAAGKYILVITDAQHQKTVQHLIIR
ncbi:MAG TPA: T9SS type A sorting domain-containing protein [Ferruginibacter sp.]|nr:T9SS type A sorting domain-containing protein [Ferruginibacter sp.]HRQ19865.1 T9SS type A sorting domain-containing protein [Ferruginibacter sp.]